MSERKLFSRNLEHRRSRKPQPQAAATSRKCSRNLGWIWLAIQLNLYRNTGRIYLMVFIERMCVRRWLVGLSISVLLCICVSAAVNSTIRICVSTAVNSTFHHCLYRLFCSYWVNVSEMSSEVWIMRAIAFGCWEAYSCHKVPYKIIFFTLVDRARLCDLSTPLSSSPPSLSTSPPSVWAPSAVVLITPPPSFRSTPSRLVWWHVWEGECLADNFAVWCWTSICDEPRRKWCIVLVNEASLYSEQDSERKRQRDQQQSVRPSVDVNVDRGVNKRRVWTRQWTWRNLECDRDRGRETVDVNEPWGEPAVCVNETVDVNECEQAVLWARTCRWTKLMGC